MTVQKVHLGQVAARGNDGRRVFEAEKVANGPPRSKIAPVLHLVERRALRGSIRVCCIHKRIDVDFLGRGWRRRKNKRLVTGCARVTGNCQLMYMLHEAQNIRTRGGSRVPNLLRTGEVDIGRVRCVRRRKDGSDGRASIRRRTVQSTGRFGHDQSSRAKRKQKTGRKDHRDTTGNEGLPQPSHNNSWDPREIAEDANGHDVFFI